MIKFQRPLTLVLFLGSAGLACSSSNGGGGSGGSSSTGGNSSSGGTSSSGGSSSTGGSSSSGGTTSTGGVTSSGGTTATGGASTGGSSSTGGTSSTGGARSTGGSTGSGGGSGGSTGSGGKGGAMGSGSGGGTATACPTANEDKFSFFVISNAELIRQGGEDPDNKGFSKYGGNLGGIEGADKICQTAAEHVSACQSNKVWHAFLGTTKVNAIDRVGKGPWYDRNGRLWAGSLTTLVEDRPSDSDPAIRTDVPNENGVNNQNPDGTGKVDNHETLTGLGSDGKVYTQSTGGGMGGRSGGFAGGTSCGTDVGATGTGTWSPERATCWDWTRNTPEGCPRVGHTWCSTASCTPAGSGSGTNWLSVWNEGGCAPGGTLTQMGVATSVRKVGSQGGYGGFYCLAVVP